MESSESVPVHAKHWGNLQNSAGVLWLTQKLNKAVSCMGEEGTLDQLEDHGSSLSKQGYSAESSRKPRKLSEIALRKSRDSKGGWRRTERRHNLLFSDPDGSDALGIPPWSILSGSQSLSALFFEPPSLLQHHFVCMAIQTLKEEMHVYQYGQRHSLPGDDT